jgi:hypothetical protein
MLVDIALRLVERDRRQSAGGRIGQQIGVVLEVGGALLGMRRDRSGRSN